jgi:hypothetical protein
MGNSFDLGFGIHSIWDLGLRIADLTAKRMAHRAYRKKYWGSGKEGSHS